MSDCFWTDLKQTEQPACGGPAAASWMLTLDAAQSNDGGDVVLFPESASTGDTSGMPDIQAGDTVTVTGGTLWYNNGDDCAYSGCGMWLVYDSGSYVPNTGTPIPGTTDIPFDEFYTQTSSDPVTWATPSLDVGRPVASTDAGIIGNCGSDPWSTQVMGDPISFEVSGLYDSVPPVGGDYAVGFATDYDGTMHTLIGALFGFTTDEYGSLSPPLISWFAHITMRNERTGDVYHMMLFDWYCY